MNAARLLLVIPAMLALACTHDEQPRANVVPSATLTVHTTQRAAFAAVGGDTLSDSARILAIHPEPDGDALVALFTDPARAVTAGLAIIDRRMAAPQLLWPDSITAVWWTGPHTLAFTTQTGTGARLVVDIHAAEMEMTDTTPAALPRPGPLASSDSSMMERARAYTDSVHMQVGGAAQGSALTYTVTNLIPTHDGRLAAFHTTARDARGVLTNPSWYVLDRESGAVVPIDQVIGSVRELSDEAGAWSEAGSFFYAKGGALWEAEIARGASVP